MLVLGDPVALLDADRVADPGDPVGVVRHEVLVPGHQPLGLAHLFQAFAPHGGRLLHGGLDHAAYEHAPPGAGRHHGQGGKAWGGEGYIYTVGNINEYY